MKYYGRLLSVAPLALAAPLAAQTVTSLPATDAPAKKVRAVPDDREMITTAVAKGRDRLDSAISTSSLRDSEILKFGPLSVADILRDIPGIRSEASEGEGGSSISIRGLPIASDGSKFVQLQEDGLPVLEFGDIAFNGADTFLRADLNLAQVEVIRGGSASTFASNSPGGVINFQSKTGEVEGGAVQLSTGLNYEQYRVDFDQSTKISDTLRFHIGGFYRQGEGPRRTGYDAQKGGQIKFNVTKDFAGGYIRFYGKYLDDRSPFYGSIPMQITGTNGDPSFRDIPGLSANRDSLLSRYTPTHLTLDANNNPVNHNTRNGFRPVVKSFGVETKFDVSGWTVTERFRYSDISTALYYPMPGVVGAVADIAPILAGPGATARYAAGPLVGTALGAGTNGNGLLLLALQNDTHSRVDNVTNDIRASRVWAIGDAELTTTAGFYNARQTIDNDMLWTSIVSDVRGDGRRAQVDLFDAGGTAVTQNGVFGYGTALIGGAFRRSTRVDYSVNAPFGSFNYRLGRVSVGGSLRYDFGTARGTRISADLGDGRVGTVVRDIDGDGIISAPERRVGVLPISRPAPIDYDFHHLSYSAGVNFRISDPLATFARYSQGGRVNADRILFSPLVNNTTGNLTSNGAAVDIAHQAEGGVKYRQGGLTLNLTGFWAETEDSNVNNVNGSPILREYKAKGLEFEGGYRRGIFSLNGGVTYTDARITRDFIDPTLVGKRPRHQAKFIFQATPQITTERFSVGAVFIGTTDSYAQDVNLLKIPGYVTTNAFVQVRPADRLLLSLNASNLFDVDAFTAIDDPVVPANGIGLVHPLNGRTMTASVRFDF